MVVLRAYESSSTMLALGARGVLEKDNFTLIGRTCVRGRRDSVWNEWVLGFAPSSPRSERPMFLAESNGLFTLYEEADLQPRIDRLLPGRAVDVGFVVVDCAEATRIATWGEVEEATVPATYRYADMSSTIDGRPATLDYVSSRLFVGRRVDLNELGLGAAYANALSTVSLLPAPEVSRPKGVDVWLEIGSEGVLEAPNPVGRYRVVGMLSRSSDPANRWEEYCLQNLERGTFTWISVSDGHWGIAEPVEAGLVDESGASSSAALVPTADAVMFDTARYEAIGPSSVSRIDWATGRLPWSVQIGDTIQTREFLSGRFILTKEWTDDEVGWSRARYLDPDVIAKGFDKRSLPKPIGRAPNQG